MSRDSREPAIQELLQIFDGARCQPLLASTALIARSCKSCLNRNGTFLGQGANHEPQHGCHVMLFEGAFEGVRLQKAQSHLAEPAAAQFVANLHLNQPRRAATHPEAEAIPVRVLPGCVQANCAVCQLAAPNRQVFLPDPAAWRLKHSNDEQGHIM